MTRSRPFTWIAAAIFALMALVHLYRLFTHFRIVVGSHEIPRVLGGYGVNIVSTSRGLMSGKTARKENGGTHLVSARRLCLFVRGRGRCYFLSSAIWNLAVGESDWPETLSRTRTAIS